SSFGINVSTSATTTAASGAVKKRGNSAVLPLRAGAEVWACDCVAGWACASSATAATFVVARPAAAPVKPILFKKSRLRTPSLSAMTPSRSEQIARPRQTIDEAGSDRIGNDHKHDWHRPGRLE